jgi:hypothetical protein
VIVEYVFQPNFAVYTRVPGTHSIKELEKERGVYSATPHFVRTHCGDIARALLDAVPEDYFREADELGLYPNIDVRVHRLYPGDFPAYPGWHCDGEYRETYFSQPDLHRIKVHKHVTCTISSHPMGVSNTQFLAEPFTCNLDVADSEQTFWGRVHILVEDKQPKLLYDSRDGELMVFDSWTLHRAMPTKIRGWRLFFRLAMWHKPNLGAGGMLTKQEQVYKLVEGSGW